MTIAQTISLVRDAFAGEAFTSAEAHARGIGPDRLERAARAGALRRLKRGVYSVPDAERSAAWGLASTRARQLGESGVSAVISGSTSADFWDVPIVGARRGAMALNPTLYVDPSTGVRDGLRDGVRVVHAPLSPEDVWHPQTHPSIGAGLHDHGVCMPLRTAVDLTRQLPLSEPAAVAALSAAQRRHAALLDGWIPSFGADTVDEGRTRQRAHWRNESRLTDRLQDPVLRELLRNESLGAVMRTPCRGLRHVRGALPVVDPRLETALEAIAWSHMCRSGLPLPRLQQWVTGASGKRYRVDFFWPELKLIGEADGAVKYRSAADVMDEKDRHSDLLDAGLHVARWTWRDAWPAPAFIGRLERHMSRP